MKGGGVTWADYGKRGGRSPNRRDGQSKAARAHESFDVTRCDIDGNRLARAICSGGLRRLPLRAAAGMSAAPTSVRGANNQVVHGAENDWRSASRGGGVAARTGKFEEPSSTGGQQPGQAEQNRLRCQTRKGGHQIMNYINQLMVRARESKKGQTMTEYVLIIAAIAVAGYIAYQGLEGGINSIISSVTTTLKAA